MMVPSPRYLTSFFWSIAVPIFVWILFTPFSSWVDLKISHYFFEKGTFSSNPFWNLLFLYGFWPAWILMAISITGLALSVTSRFRTWLNPSLFILLTFAIGSGLIVHGALKDNWGRPRPKQVEEFGGKQNFRPYYEPNLYGQPEPSRSFSCGHCSTGFTFFSVAILGSYYRSRLWRWIGWSLAWGLGIFLSLSRIALGGHFFSDTLASALIMWITAWTLATLLIFDNKGKKNEGNHL